MGESEGLWWIDSFKMFPGQYYRYKLTGRNDLDGGRVFYWTVPDLRGGGTRYAFALRPV